MMKVEFLRLCIGGSLVRTDHSVMQHKCSTVNQVNQRKVLALLSSYILSRPIRLGSSLTPRGGYETTFGPLLDTVQHPCWNPPPPIENPLKNPHENETRK